MNYVNVEFYEWIIQRIATTMHQIYVIIILYLTHLRHLKFVN